MRALVIGASGQVGAALCEELSRRRHDVAGTYARAPRPGLRSLDLTDHAATERLIADLSPDVVFCPAALTHVDYCEDHPEEASRINRDAPAAAARAIADRGGAFVFYSTEYVFDGTGGPYAEDDPVNPLSVYGRSKLQGEQAVLDANALALIVRTTVVYGPDPQGKNFVYQLLRRARAGERMTIPSDQVSSPTYNADLAAASVELAERGLTGVFHVAGSAILDRFVFAQEVCAAFGVDGSRLEAVSTASLGQRAARPLRAGLRIDRARAVLESSLRAPPDGLRAMRAVLEAASASPSTPIG